MSSEPSQQASPKASPQTSIQASPEPSPQASPRDSSDAETEAVNNGLIHLEPRPSLQRSPRSSVFQIDWSERLQEVFLILLPWLFAMLLGVVTAIFGSYISVNCDFLSDLRFGYCRGMYFADRNRCCGGSDNLDILRGRCQKPLVVYGMEVGPSAEWVPWSELFGLEGRFRSTAGFLLSLSFYTVPSIIFSGLAAFLVFEYAPFARGSGIPEVKAAVSGFDLPNHLSAWCLLVKTFGLSLVVGAGLSLGKEGPLIQIGACCAQVLQKLVLQPVELFVGLPGDPLPLHELACIGSAAGVSTAFGAPLGGVLFVAEELGSMRELNGRTLLFSFMAAFSASFTLKHFNLSGANKLTMFSLSVPTHDIRKEWMAWEMVAFLFLGALGGLVGVIFIRFNLLITRRRRKAAQDGRLWMLPESVQNRLFGCFIGRTDGEPEVSKRALNVTEACIIAFVTALLNFPFTELLRNLSTEAIHALFETCPSHHAHHFGLCDSEAEGKSNMSDSINTSFIVSAVVRVFQTSFTFGAAIPSGLFIPSMFIGATMGRFVGNTLSFFNDGFLVTNKWHIEPGVFAMVGAVASLSGFCRMTVSLVVIMFELTGELTYVVPFMCAVLSAKLIGDLMSPSIYDGHAKLNGYAPVEEQHDVRFVTYVSDLASEPKSEAISVISETTCLPLEELVQHVELEREMLVIIREDEQGQSTAAERIIGVVEPEQLQIWLAKQDLSDSQDVRVAFSKSVTEDKLDSNALNTIASAALPNSPREGITISSSSVPARRHISTLDASEVIDSDIVRLAVTAPLLTAQCSFEQKLELRFCVCSYEQTPAAYSVLSREVVHDAMNHEQFSLGRPRAIRGADVHNARPVGTGAAWNLLCQAWHHSPSETSRWHALSDADLGEGIVIGATTACHLEDVPDALLGENEDLGSGQETLAVVASEEVPQRPSQEFDPFEERQVDRRQSV